jgi:hypothetical protein
MERDVKQLSREPPGVPTRRFAVAGALISGIVGISSLPSASASPGRVMICHATGSTSNPYVQIAVSENAVREGGGHNRDGHQNGEDIIPPGRYDPDGRNWDAEGQVIYDDGCLIFAPGILPPSR